MPIKIHILPTPIGLDGAGLYLADLQYGMREWETAAAGGYSLWRLTPATRRTFG